MRLVSERTISLKEVMLGKKKANDIGTELSRGKAAHENTGIEENAHGYRLRHFFEDIVVG